MWVLGFTFIVPSPPKRTHNFVIYKFTARLSHHTLFPITHFSLRSFESYSLTVGSSRLLCNYCHPIFEAPLFTFHTFLFFQISFADPRVGGFMKYPIPNQYFLFPPPSHFFPTKFDRPFLYSILGHFFHCQFLDTWTKYFPSIFLWHANNTHNLQLYKADGGLPHHTLLPFTHFTVKNSNTYNLNVDLHL